VGPDRDTGGGGYPPSAVSLGLPLLALVLLVPVLLWPLDQALFFWFNGLSDLTGAGFWAHVTVLGDGLVCAVLFLPWIRRHPERVWGGLLGALVMFLTLHAVKKLTGQPRPLAVFPEETINVIGPGLRTRAFPSGHTATVALYAGILALTTPRRMAVAFAIVLAVMVGVSRMVVGVHWPSDVLAGLALGWVSAWAGLLWGSRAGWGTRPTGRRILGGALMVAAIVLLFIDHTGYPNVLWFLRGLAVICLTLGGRAFLQEILGPQARGPGQGEAV
jgi:membrane-associated phospholipid phosphatase